MPRAGIELPISPTHQSRRYPGETSVRGSIAAQASAEKLKQTESAKKERVALVSPNSCWQGSQSHSCQKKRNRAICRDHQIVPWGRVKVSETRNLAQKKGSDREQGEERVDSSVKEGRFQGGEGGKAKRTSLGKVERSISKRST